MNHKSHLYREETPPRDSGSESTPLLSSEPRTSPEPVLFDDTETSDLDLSLNHPFRFSRYGTIDADCYGTAVTALLKRPPPLTKDNELLIPTTANPPCTVNLVREKNYDPRGIDPIRTNGTVDTRNYTRKKLHEANFEAGSLQFQHDDVARPVSGKDCTSKQSSLVTVQFFPAAERRGKTHRVSTAAAAAAAVRILQHSCRGEIHFTQAGVVLLDIEPPRDARISGADRSRLRSHVWKTSGDADRAPPDSPFSRPSDRTRRGTRACSNEGSKTASRARFRDAGTKKGACARLAPTPRTGATTGTSRAAARRFSPEGVTALVCCPGNRRPPRR